MNYARKPQPLPVAEVKPGDFPLGSMESRADSKSRSRNVLGEQIGGTERSLLI